MSDYIKNFVTGHGINFDNNKRNHDTFERAASKWLEISSNLPINGDSVIMFCGGKNNGKSSLIRFIVNKYNGNIHNDNRNDPMSEESRRKNGKDHDDDDIRDMCESPAQNRNSSIDNNKFAYFVDFDPGQAEMTTPGLVSAHLIKSNAQPLLSPTYLNVLQHEPLASSSVGGLNVSVNPQLYIENCRYVFNKVKEHQNSIAERTGSQEKRPIFINTMGYIRNVGLAMLMDLIKICRPTNLIVLNIESDPMRTIYADLSPKAIENTPASFYYQTSHDGQANSLNYEYDLYNLDFAFIDSTSVATKNRIALQLAYFASIPEAIYKPIMQLSPKLVPFSSVSIYCVSSYPLKAEIVLELLYHSWVHLVKLNNKLLDRTPATRRVEQSQQPSEASETSQEEISCNLIDDIGENSFFGCGIVANIDIDKKSLSIVTPLSQEIIDENVNCVIKPLSIQVPREMILTSE